MKQLIKKFKKSKNKKDSASDTNVGGSGAVSNTSSTPSLVTAVTPVVGTSTAALSLNQIGGRTSISSQPPTTTAVSNEPMKRSYAGGTHQEATSEASTLKSDTANQNFQEPENKPTSSEIPKREETKPVSRALGQQLRAGAIKALEFASVISEATDLLKPVKAVADAIKKVLETAKVRDCPLILFTHSLIKNDL
jgi:hypothetical protein